MTFRPPEAVPWSELGPSFMAVWGRPEPEHMEITGQTGSGKSYLLATLLQERALYRGTAEILVVTKQGDRTLERLGWPVAGEWAEVRRWRQAVFWPRTTATGGARQRYHEKQIYDLLTRLWQPDANVLVAFDEIGYVEGLSARLRAEIRMWWREARSNGITIVAMKQRPIGVVRDQHSETRWKCVFPPADRGDLDRFAELLGAPRDWAPVLDSLDQQQHQFVIRNSATREAYVSWVDYELEPVPAQAAQQPAASAYGRARRRRPEPAAPYTG
jgi:hypothetical protein